MKPQAPTILHEIDGGAIPDLGETCPKRTPPAHGFWRASARGLDTQCITDSGSWRGSAWLCWAPET